jgi:hypothetical protein
MKVSVLIVMLTHLSFAFKPVVQARLNGLRGGGVRGIFGRWMQKYDGDSPLQKLRNELERSDDTVSCNSNTIGRCLEYMSQVKASDLGIEKIGPLSRQLCMSVLETDRYHMAAFLIPTGKQIPVHDHPGMSVYSKLIAGKLRTRSFTRVDTTQKAHRFQAKLHEDVVRTPNDKAWYITATEGNFHEFIAIEDCVILDVLSPPYAYPSRPCTFYAVTKLPTGETAQGTVEGTTASTSRATTSGEQLWELSAVPEDVIEHRYGLPVGVSYKGYVPQPPKR